MKYKLTISGNVGTDKDQLKRAKEYFEKSFNTAAVTLRSKKNLSNLKIRKDLPVGFKKTFRKDDAKKYLTVLAKTINVNQAKYSNNTFTIGVPDHHLLKLQQYRVDAPNFGLLFVITLEPPGTRCYRRKYKVPQSRNKLILSESDARFALTQLL